MGYDKSGDNCGFLPRFLDVFITVIYYTPNNIAWPKVTTHPVAGDANRASFSVDTDNLHWVYHLFHHLLLKTQ